MPMIPRKNYVYGGGGASISVYKIISIISFIIGALCGLSAILLWFRYHIYQIIQDLNGTSRAKQVQYMKNNSLLLYTKINSQKVHNINQLVEAYLHHKTEEIQKPADIIFPTSISQIDAQWSPYSMGEKTEFSGDVNIDINQEDINQEHINHKHMSEVYKREAYKSELAEDDSPITEVLSEYEILAKDGESIEVLFQNQPYLYNRVVLPVKKEVSFAIIKSCVVVHWSKVGNK